MKDYVIVFINSIIDKFSLSRVCPNENITHRRNKIVEIRPFIEVCIKMLLSGKVDKIST